MPGKSNGGAEVRVGRPRMPESYGVPESVEGTLSWEYVSGRMGEAPQLLAFHREAGRQAARRAGLGRVGG